MNLRLILIASSIWFTAAQSVSLKQVGKHPVCPSDIGKVQCNASSAVVIWLCNNDTPTERAVVCSNNDSIVSFMCRNTMTQIQVYRESCWSSSLDGATMITSSLVYNISTEQISITCTDGTESQTLRIEIEVPSIPILHTTYQVQPANNKKKRIITVQWHKSSSNEQPTYHVTVVGPQTTECPQGKCATFETELNLTMALEQEYSITVAAKTCNDTVESNESLPLTILLQGPPKATFCKAQIVMENDSHYSYHVEWTFDSNTPQNSLDDCQSNLSCLVNFVSNQENATTNSRIESCSSACWNQHNGSMEYNILNISITAINTVDIGESKSCDLDYKINEDNNNSKIEEVTAGLGTTGGVVLICVGILVVCWKTQRHRFITRMLTPNVEVHQKHGPRALVVYKDKEIITCYKQWSHLQVYTSKLKEERRINLKNEENTEKFTIENPRGMSVDSDGNLYITDSNTHHLFKFSPTGQLVKKKGGCGKTFGKLHSPKGVVVIKDHVLVCDLFNRRIQSFNRKDLNPEFVFYLPQKYLCPFHIAYNEGQKRLYITGTNFIYVCELVGDLEVAESLKVLCFIRKYKEENNDHYLQRIGGVALQGENLVISETFQNSVILLKVEITSTDRENIPFLIERHYGTYIQDDKSPDEDMVNEFKIVRCRNPQDMSPKDAEKSDHDTLEKPHPVVMCCGFIFVSNDCTKQQSLKRYTKQSTSLKRLELKLPVAMDTTYQQ